MIFFIWTIIALFYFPIYYIGGDYIGVYDIAIIFVGMFVLILNLKTFKLKKNQHTLFLFALLVYIIVITLINYSFDPNIFRVLVLINFIKFIIAIAIAYFLISKLDVRKALKIIFFSYVMLFVANIINFIYNPWWNMNLIYHNVGSGAVLGFISASFILFLVMFKKYLNNYLFYILLFLSTINLVLAQGRTQIIALIVVVSFYLFMTKKLNLRFFSYFFGILAISILYLDIDWNQFYGGNIFQYFNPSNVVNDHSFSLRISLWSDELNELFNNVIITLFGKGLGHSRYIDGMFVNLFISLGLFGFYLLIYLMYLVIKKSVYLKYLIILIAISSITGELMLQSYRTQAAIAIFIAFLIYIDKLIILERRKNEKLFNNNTSI